MQQIAAGFISNDRFYLFARKPLINQRIYERKDPFRAHYFGHCHPVQPQSGKGVPFRATLITNKLSFITNLNVATSS